MDGKQSSSNKNCKVFKQNLFTQSAYNVLNIEKKKDGNISATQKKVKKIKLNKMHHDKIQ